MNCVTCQNKFTDSEISQQQDSLRFSSARRRTIGRLVVKAVGYLGRSLPEVLLVFAASDDSLLRFASLELIRL